MSRKPDIHFHIEQLVLDGFPSTDRLRIGGAVQRELARLFAEERTPSGLSKSAAIDRLNGGTFPMTPAPRPEATGTQVARAIFGGLKQ